MLMFLFIGFIIFIILRMFFSRSSEVKRVVKELIDEGTIIDENRINQLNNLIVTTESNFDLSAIQIARIHLMAAQLKIDIQNLEKKFKRKKMLDDDFTKIKLLGFDKEGLLFKKEEDQNFKKRITASLSNKNTIEENVSGFKFLEEKFIYLKDFDFQMEIRELETNSGQGIKAFLFTSENLSVFMHLGLTRDGDLKLINDNLLDTLKEKKSYVSQSKELLEKLDSDIDLKLKEYIKIIMQATIKGISDNKKSVYDIL